MTRWITAAILALLPCASVGVAQEPVAAPRSIGDVLQASPDSTHQAATLDECCDNPRKWSFRFIPYGWIPGFHGDQTIRGVKAPVEVSIAKTWDIIFDSIDFGAMGQFEGSNGRFGFIFNGLYIDVSPKQRVRNLNFTEDLVATILDLTATVNLLEDPESLGLPCGSRLELLGGFRYVALSGGLRVNGPFGRSLFARGTVDWFDPIVGSRARVPLTDRLTAQVRGDVGGFDWAEASRFTWNIEATLEYKFNCRTSLIAGYRWLDIDKVEGSGREKFQFDMNLNGPILGFAFGF